MIIRSGPHILRLLGPACINAYGLMLALGLLVFFYFVINDQRRKTLVSDPEKIVGFLFKCALAGIIGARLVYIFIDNLKHYLSHPLEIFAVWDGGLSMLGALIAIPPVVYYLLNKNKIPLFPFLDLICTYIPLLEAITRIGCLLAGCCHGAKATTNTILKLIYTHPESLAPINKPLIPTQIYSSLLSLVLFGIIYKISKHDQPKGRIFWTYFTASAAIRFFVDFWRGDRGALLYHLSGYQWIALFLATIGIFGLLLSENWHDYSKEI